MSTESHSAYRSGFVAVVGAANVGKSTLVNAIVGQRLCITTSKAQTTRHRILGVAVGENYQLALTDTPGLHEPKYELQRTMIGAARKAARDAEVILIVFDIFQPLEEMESVRAFIAETELPIIVAVNKMDLLRNASALSPAALELTGGSEESALERAAMACPGADIILPVSALTHDGVSALTEELVAKVPLSEPIYPLNDDVLTDRPSRFFAAEIIREKIFELYSKEIPYASEVRIEAFKEDRLPALLEIHANIIVSRDSQKKILVGAKGSAIKETGIAARKALEDFFQVSKVHLVLRVKVSKSDWRSDDTTLRRFGYIE